MYTCVSVGRSLILFLHYTTPHSPQQHNGGPYTYVLCIEMCIGGMVNKCIECGDAVNAFNVKFIELNFSFFLYYFYLNEIKFQLFKQKLTKKKTK